MLSAGDDDRYQRSTASRTITDVPATITVFHGEVAAPAYGPGFVEDTVLTWNGAPVATAQLWRWEPTPEKSLPTVE